MLSLTEFCREPVYLGETTAANPQRGAAQVTATLTRSGSFFSGVLRIRNGYKLVDEVLTRDPFTAEEPRDRPGWRCRGQS
ncbi:MAG TPA: hypothetical protein VEO53_15365 [Candidatus Binatia bacterium]|nr:hypothetical protein [Candidatus Binatia bacterium]